MASLTKTKVLHGVKLKRGSTQPPLSTTDRTRLKTQEIPPALCHLTGDALATPFPPIAPGGYIKYYKMHYECDEQQQQQNGDAQRRAGLDWEISESLDTAKRKRRRASSVSTFLGPLLSHTPEPSPSQEVPPKSHLFHTRSPSSPESVPSSPVSPSSSRSSKRRFLSVIHEVSRETMRSDTAGDNTTVSKLPRKLRVVSLPPSLPAAARAPSLGASALALSFITPSRSHSGKTMSLVPLSPMMGSLRRKKRQVLRTPSVENDFARHAKDILGLPNDFDRPLAISRESSSGSDTTEEEENSLSPTMSVNTAMTSLLDPSSLPSSPTNLESRENAQPHDSVEPSNYVEITTRCASSSPDPAPPGAFPHAATQIKSPAKSGSYQSIGSEALSESSTESPTISTPPTSVGECNMAEDKKLHDSIVTESNEEDDEDKRDSWASYETAKSSLDTPVATDAPEMSPEDEDLKKELTASVHAFQALVALNE